VNSKYSPPESRQRVPDFQKKVPGWWMTDMSSVVIAGTWGPLTSASSAVGEFHIIPPEGGDTLLV